MQITDVRVRKVEKEGKMKAVVSITIDEEFVVHDIKVIEGEKGLFIAMPSRKAADGEYRDIAHPINSDTRARIQQIILDKYEAELATEPAESEDSYNEEEGNEILEETAESQTKADTMTESEIEKENSIFVSSSYSESDYELLCEITYAEAGNQTEEQQVAAAATILNRVESDSFPNTIKEVIMQKGQFASTRNGHIYAHFVFF